MFGKEGINITRCLGFYLSLLLPGKFGIRLFVFPCSHAAALSHQPYLLAMGNGQDGIDNYYIALDSKLIPCQTEGSLDALDELFKVHYVFNISYANALISFYTFLQTTVYNIDVGNPSERALSQIPE